MDRMALNVSIDRGHILAMELGDVADLHVQEDAIFCSFLKNEAHIPSCLDKGDFIRRWTLEHFFDAAVLRFPLFDDK